MIDGHELARRLIQCRHFRWMPGMGVTSMHVYEWEWMEEGYRTAGRPMLFSDAFRSPDAFWSGCHQRPVRGIVSEEAELGEVFVVRWLHPLSGCNEWDVWGHALPPDILPDLDSPATLGCLLAMVRSAWGDPCALVCYIHPDDDNERGYWCLEKAWANADDSTDGATEAEALIAALEAAP